MLSQELQGVNYYDPVLQLQLSLRKICQAQYGFSLTRISPDKYRICPYMRKYTLEKTRALTYSTQCLVPNLLLHAGVLNATLPIYCFVLRNFLLLRLLYNRV